MSVASFSSSVLSEDSVREGKPVRPRRGLAGSQARQYQGLFTHKKPESRKRTHPTSAVAAGLGGNDGSLACDSQCSHYSSSVYRRFLLGRGLFQPSMDFFCPRGGRQLGHRPDGVLTCSSQSTTSKIYIVQDSQHQSFQRSHCLYPHEIRATE